ncbi:hypothetical protein HDU97_006023 [Phlyctochytrium planicorne]|nr:hypothetical protein HDU97_006023 [Phlyctochytrium planicorne]
MSYGWASQLRHFTAAATAPAKGKYSYTAIGTGAAVLATTAYIFYPKSPEQTSTSKDKRSSILDKFSPISKEDVDRKLKTNEISTILSDSSFSQKFGLLSALGLSASAPSIKAPVARFDTNSVNSNEPCEDYHSEHQFNGSLIFSILDGHGGLECSSLLSKYLSSYVASGMAKLPPLQKDESASSRKQIVTAALKEAFNRMDTDIINGGIPLEGIDYNSKMIAGLRSAIAGACALVAYIEGNDIYICCTGDSRAVLGSRTSEGRFISTDLSADQTIKNPEEYARLIDEHPGELETVVVKGRVLGGLMPTRAFGDARYKWPLELQDKVLPFASRRHTPKNFKTPPYITAEPEVVHYRMDPSRDKFLVLATDGLYDVLESDEVVHIVGGYMTQNGLVSESNEPLKISGSDQWLHVDDNAATDLIRNALGGRDEEKTQKLLGIPAPYSRRFRDDITVNVVFFGDRSQFGSLPKPFKSQTSLPAVDLGLAGNKRHRIQEWSTALSAKL